MGRKRLQGLAQADCCSTPDPAPRGSRRCLLGIGVVYVILDPRSRRCSPCSLHWSLLCVLTDHWRGKDLCSTEACDCTRPPLAPWLLPACTRPLLSSAVRPDPCPPCSPASLDTAPTRSQLAPNDTARVCYGCRVRLCSRLTLCRPRDPTSCTPVNRKRTR
ncbi:hypothetical protein C8Q77DRAFT_484289 [Trametes polyzona]|nr:hypothetical protein C8Q77DRAFT_484289 [Trametes polyzona]